MVVCKHDVVTLVDGQKLCVLCGDILNRRKYPNPPLKPIHREVLNNVIENFPQAFKRNVTDFFWTELWRYIHEQRVSRTAIMGETRSGKSEGAQTIAVNYKIIYNRLYSLGHFDNVDLSTNDKEQIIKLEPITFTIDNINADQTEYLFNIRKMMRENNFVFGHINIIDEDKQAGGGMGSFSEHSDLANLNNIVAKFMVSEVWIKPNQFLNRNTPYGLTFFIKDINNRVNWALLYKMEMRSVGVKPETLIGWVNIGLHNDDDLRKSYSFKKNEWIIDEYKGRPSARVRSRHEAMSLLADDSLFNETTVNKNGSLRFVKTLEQQKVIFENKVVSGELQNFNESEIERIIQGARLLVEEREKKINKD